MLSSLAAQCDLFRHVMTQAPYVAVVALWSILVGTLPVGRGRYSTGVGIFLGFVMTLFTTFAIGVPVISRTGRFGPLQELIMRFDKRSGLHLLKKHTAMYYERGGPVSKDEEVVDIVIPEGGYKQSILGRMAGAKQSILGRGRMDDIQEEDEDVGDKADADKIDEESGTGSGGADGGEPQDVTEAFVEEDKGEQA